jgi:hypothetical protein
MGEGVTVFVGDGSTSIVWVGVTVAVGVGTAVEQALNIKISRSIAGSSCFFMVISTTLL